MGKQKILKKYYCYGKAGVKFYKLLVTILPKHDMIRKSTKFFGKGGVTWDI